MQGSTKGSQKAGKRSSVRLSHNGSEGEPEDIITKMLWTDADVSTACCVLLLLLLLWLLLLLLYKLPLCVGDALHVTSLPLTQSLALSLSYPHPHHTPLSISHTHSHTPQPQKMTIAEKMGGSPFVRNGRNVLTKLTNKAPVKKLRGENTRLVRYCYVVLCANLFYSILSHSIMSCFVLLCRLCISYVCSWLTYLALHSPFNLPNTSTFIHTISDHFFLNNT